MDSPWYIYINSFHLCSTPTPFFISGRQKNICQIHLRVSLDLILNDSIIFNMSNSCSWSLVGAGGVSKISPKRIQISGTALILIKSAQNILSIQFTIYVFFQVKLPHDHLTYQQTSTSFLHDLLQ